MFWTRWAPITCPPRAGRSGGINEYFQGPYEVCIEIHLRQSLHYPSGIQNKVSRGSRGASASNLVCKLRQKIRDEEYRYGIGVKMTRPLVLGEKPPRPRVFACFLTLDGHKRFLRNKRRLQISPMIARPILRPRVPPIAPCVVYYERKNV